MKVSIIGCCGYMGSHLKATLSAQGTEVVGFSSTDGSGVDPESGLFGMSSASWCEHSCIHGAVAALPSCPRSGITCDGCEYSFGRACGNCC